MLFHLVSMTHDGIIGKNGTPPWYQESSERYFEQITRNHTIIMGRKSYEAFGYHKYMAKKIIVVSRAGVSLEEALCETQDEPKVFIAGGLSLYQQTMSFVDGIYMNRIFHKYRGNILYPQIHFDIKLKHVEPYEDDPEVSLYYYERNWKIED